MGVYDRDYYRENDPARGPMFGGGATVVCKRLIAANVAVYILQLLTLRNSPLGGLGVTDWLALVPGEVLKGQVWRILTYAFCHSPDSLMHIVFNMLGLWFCGSTLEVMYGSREFLKFYLTAAIVAGLSFLGLELMMGSHDLAIGASGAVAAIIVVFAMHFPRAVFYIFFVIPIEARWMVILFAVWDLYPVLVSLGGGFVNDHIAHVAHVGGYLYGFLYKYFDLRFSRWKSLPTRQAVKSSLGMGPKVKLYEPPPAVDQEKLDQRVDEILAKISAHGEASLTDAERQTLKDAAQRYKQR